MRVKFHN